MKSLWNKVKPYANEINLLGKEVEFEINGFSKVPSCVGTLLSLMCLGLILPITYRFIYRALDTTHPDITITTKTLAEYPTIDLHQQKFYFAMIPRNLKNGLDDLPKLGTLTAAIHIKEFVTDSSTGEVKTLRFESVELDIKVCEEVKTQFSFLANNQNLKGFLKDSICFLPKPGKEQYYKVVGQTLEDIHTTLEVRLNPCIMAPPSECYTAPEIKEVSFLLLYPSPNIDYSKTSDFFTWIAVAGPRILVDPGTDQVNSVYLKTHQLYKDTSFLKEAELEHDYVSISDQFMYSNSRDASVIACDAADVGSQRKCPPYFELSVSASNELQIVTRSYINLIEALSEVGGFREVILMIFGSIYFVYNCFAQELRLYIVNSVYGHKHTRDEFRRQVAGVDDHLDVVQLIKELNGLRVLNRLIFQDYHLSLFPELLVKLKEEEELRIEQEKKSKWSKVSSINLNARKKEVEGSMGPQGEQSQPNFLQGPNNKSYLRSGMTFLENTKTAKEQAMLRLKNSKATDHLTLQLNQLFLRYLAKGEEANSAQNEILTDQRPQPHILMQNLSSRVAEPIKPHEEPRRFVQNTFLNKQEKSKIVARKRNFSRSNRQLEIARDRGRRFSRDLGQLGRRPNRFKSSGPKIDFFKEALVEDFEEVEASIEG